MENYTKYSNKAENQFYKTADPAKHTTVSDLREDDVKMERPKVKLVGTDGNAFAILARCIKAARIVGWTPQERADFSAEAMEGDYDNLLQTVHEYFDVE